VKPTFVTYGVLLEGYCDAGDRESAEAVLPRMRKAKLKVTSYPYDQLIASCGDDEDAARRLMGQMVAVDRLEPTAWTQYALFKVMLRAQGQSRSGEARKSLDDTIVSLFEELET
jgi:pentatricopeptide repeat protein